MTFRNPVHPPTPRPWPRLMAICVIWTLLLTALALVAPRLHGQQAFAPSTNPVSDAVRARLTRDSKNLIAAAELMPADKYGYQPTPAQMTFGQLVAHIVQTNVAICSAIAGTPAPMTPEDMKKLSGTDPKDALVAAIKKSFDYCTEGLAKTQDATLGEEVSMFGRQTGQSRGAALVTIAVDWADHYSTAASYLRLNGILPPSAPPKK
jgi:uncharacterized damage-inducible protein DinB